MNDETNRKIRVSLTRFVCTDLWAPKSSSFVIRMSSFLLVQGGYLSHGSFISCFQEEKGESECPCTCRFSSAFNSKYAICQSDISCGGIFCIWVLAHLACDLAQRESHKFSVPPPKLIFLQGSCLSVALAFPIAIAPVGFLPAAQVPFCSHHASQPPQLLAIQPFLGLLYSLLIFLEGQKGTWETL